MRRRNKIGFSSRMFLSSMSIWPEVGSIRRLTMRNRVVLPEPEVPRSMQITPSCTPNVTIHGRFAGAWIFFGDFVERDFYHALVHLSLWAQLLTLECI